MGVDSRRPPLPAPTDISSTDNGISDDVATDVSRVTEKTSYSLHENGEPVTIVTKRPKDGKKDSQTSLLIEYFEAARSGDGPSSRPSVRVRVTPSGSRKSRSSHDHIQITETSKNRKPSYTRRISLPGNSKDIVGSEISSASDASSGRPPIEVEVLQNFSELSQSGDNSSHARYIVPPSDISSLPADSMLDGPIPVLVNPRRRRSDSLEKTEVVAQDTLKAPSRQRSRSVSRDRILPKVMEKLQKDSTVRIRDGKHKTDRSSRSRSVSKEHIVEDVQSSKSRSGKYREDSRDRSLQPSEISAVSSRSINSSTSINNPRLLIAVEDAIKKLILPELNALKEEQKTIKNRTKYEEITRDSKAPAGSRSREDIRRLSKSSSLPSVNRQPEIVSDDRGVIHAGESSRRRSSRRSSRGSTSDKSYDTAVHDDTTHRSRRRSKDKSHTREILTAGAAGIIGAGLVSAALKHHASSSTMDKDHRRRSSRSKSRSRSASLSESRSEHIEHDVPPLPMQSVIESDVTRDSILSADTERPSSRSSRGTETAVREIREVSRGSPRHITSPSPRTPLRSPASLKEGLLTHHSNDSHEELSPRSNRSTPSRSGKGRLAAAGAGAALGAIAMAATHHHRDDHHLTPRTQSPIQSDTSYLDERGEVAEHPRVRSIKSNKSMSSEKKVRKSRSLVSAESSPSLRLAESKKRPDAISLERAYEILPEDEFREATPQYEEVDNWLDHEHELNDRYREELDRDSQLSSARDSHHHTGYAEDEYADDYSDRYHENENVKQVSYTPEYIHTPVAVESAVASLQDPSTISIHSSAQASPTRDFGNEHTHPTNLDRDLYVAAAAPKQLAASKERWEIIRDRAMAMTSHSQDRDGFESPDHSETRSIDEKPILGARYVPIPGDMPDISHIPDDESELITNPSIISGRIGGDEYDTPYLQNEPDHGHADHHHTRDTALLGAALGTGLGLEHVSHSPKNLQYQPSVEEEADRDLPTQAQSPDLRQNRYAFSPVQNKDEGYISAAHGGVSPAPQPNQARDFDNDSLNQYDEEMEDPFTTQKHLRHESGLSHGMSSPLYDNATGKGVDRIQSKDVVALMDHLTVRDAQRNARDTEILVTLVRSAAEMRNNFEEMKRYIAEQDRLIMNNVERGQDLTVQRVLSGPRPQPTNSPRTVRRQISDEKDDLPTRRKNVLKRALRGLSGRGHNDLGKIEDMLMQLLNEVEGLKDTQVMSRPSNTHTQTTSLNSYEHLRAAPDSGYEPEGQAGTNSSPAQSGHLSNPSSRQFVSMHSGYDRRGSDGNRISTVLEGDEEVEEAATAARTGQYEVQAPVNSSPSQEVQRSIPMETPPEQTGPFQSAEPTPKTDKSRSRHKSNASSVFSGFPKISRWSKTTASTAADSVRNSAQKKERPYSQGSRSGSNLQLDYDYYDMNENDRLRSTNSLLAEENAARVDRSRPQSPLVPERASISPKYQAHRISLDLAHPQPRPGPTHRHQTYLETQAIDFENPPTPDADHWGSAPALALNKSRFSGSSAPHGLSPVYSDGGSSQHSASEQVTGPPRPAKIKDDGPLVPAKIPFTSPESSYSMYDMPMASSGMHIASPLEPIEEVRYSLETDRSSVRLEATPSPRPTAMHSTQRRITGPRDMPRSGSAGSSIKRRPVSSDSLVSFETYRTSLDSETF